MKSHAQIDEIEIKGKGRKEEVEQRVRKTTKQN